MRVSDAGTRPTKRWALWLLLSLAAAMLVAACGTSKAEEAAKTAKADLAAGQVCAAASLEPTETTYRTACEAKQRKEKSEHEVTEKHEAAERKSKENEEAAKAKKEAAERKAEEAKTKQEEASKRAEEKKQEEASHEQHTTASGQQSVPNVVGKALPEAESELESKGIQFSSQTINGDVVILRGDWGVCSTTPAAGEPANGAVVLHLGHFQCGA
jgi:outer membrane biosynthesis protein TonB